MYHSEFVFKFDKGQGTLLMKTVCKYDEYSLLNAVLQNSFLNAALHINDQLMTEMSLLA